MRQVEEAITRTLDFHEANVITPEPDAANE
jgi:hypothetical protein